MRNVTYFILALLVSNALILGPLRAADNKITVCSTFKSAQVIRNAISAIAKQYYNMNGRVDINIIKAYRYLRKKYNVKCWDIDFHEFQIRFRYKVSYYRSNPEVVDWALYYSDRSKNYGYITKISELKSNINKIDNLYVIRGMAVAEFVDSEGARRFVNWHRHDYKIIKLEKRTLTSK